MMYTAHQLKRKKQASNPDLELDKEILKELRRERVPSPPPDEDNLFGSSIGATLKSMAPQQKALAKICFQQELYETQY